MVIIRILPLMLEFPPLFGSEAIAEAAFEDDQEIQVSGNLSGWVVNPKPPGVLGVEAGNDAARLRGFGAWDDALLFPFTPRHEQSLAVLKSNRDAHLTC